MSGPVSPGELEKAVGVRRWADISSWAALFRDRRSSGSPIYFRWPALTGPIERLLGAGRAQAASGRSFCRHGGRALLGTEWAERRARPSCSFRMRTAEDDEGVGTAEHRRNRGTARGKVPPLSRPTALFVRRTPEPKTDEG